MPPPDFPNEAEAIERIAAELAMQLTCSKHWLSISANVTQDNIVLRKRYPAIVLTSLITLFVRSCRRHRQVIALSELGQADGAEVICRSMFEGYLSLAFIARQSVRLRRRQGNKPTNQFGRRLTQGFRAELFRAHCLLKYEKYLLCLEGVPGTKRFARARLKERPEAVSDIDKVIGKDWKNAIKKGSTCAGLSVEDLAHSMGAYDWYRAIYADQSSSVHISDAAQYLTYQPTDSAPTLHLQSEMQDVEKSLWVATGLMGLCFNEFARILDKECPRYLEAGLFSDSIDELKLAFGKEKKG